MSGARTTLRIARRDAVRHPAQALLIIVLIALPVMGAVALDVIVRSSQASPAESVAGQLAGSDAWLWAPQGLPSIEQNMDGTNVSFPDDIPADRMENVYVAPPRPASEVLGWLPPGSSITLWEQSGIPLLAADGRWVAGVADQLDITVPAAGHRYQVIEGSAPRNPHEVALTERAADLAGVTVGGTVMAGAPARGFTVAGIVEPAVGRDTTVIVAQPGTLPVLAGYSDQIRYLVRSTAPLDETAVRELNSHGVQVFSRFAVLAATGDPRATPQTPTDLLAIAASSIVAVLGVLQVVFLAGPAFAVGARRMRRQLGQLTAVGAGPRQVRQVVLAGGAFLGLIGSLLGALVGLAVGIWAQPLLTSWLGMSFIDTHVAFAEIIGICAIGLLTAILAALIPAISIARVPAVQLLGREPARVRGALRAAAVGLVAFALGVIITLVAATRPLPVDSIDILTGRGLWLATGVVFTQIGLLLATPLLLHWSAGLGARLPTSARLAMRDGDRHRGRTAPAVAAVMAVTSVAVVAAIFITSVNADRNARYQPQLSTGQVVVSIQDGGSGRPADETAVRLAAEMLGRQWPGSDPEIVGNAIPGNLTLSLDWVVPPANRCPWFAPGRINEMSADEARRPPAEAELPSAQTDWRCAGMGFSPLSDEQSGTHNNPTYGTGLQKVAVGGPAVRRALTTIDDPVADAALAQGKAVIFDRRYLDAAGRLTGTLTHYPVDDATGAVAPVLVGTPTIPAVLARWSPTPGLVAIVPPQSLAGMALVNDQRTLVVQPPTVLDATDQQNTEQALAAAGVDGDLYVERGYFSYGNEPSIWLVLAMATLLIALTVTVITALGVADARPDLATLAAVGARSGTRRLMAGWSALAVTGIGCGLGVLLGLVPAWGVMRLERELGGLQQVWFSVPWRPLLGLGLVLPAAAFVLAALFTRSRIPMVRRLE